MSVAASSHLRFDSGLRRDRRVYYRGILRGKRVCSVFWCVLQCLSRARVPFLRRVLFFVRLDVVEVLVDLAVVTELPQPGCKGDDGVLLVLV